MGEGFTKSTIEMVALAAAEEAEAVLAEQPRRRRRQRWMAAAVSSLWQRASGTRSARRFGRYPNKPLLQDLKVVENLDSYYQVDDIDFLRTLESEGLFADGDTDRAN